MEVTVKIDATRALAKFSPSGIPESVRRNLRGLIPDLTRRLGALAEDNLIGGVKSWTNIQFKKEMVENRNEITGRVRVLWNGDPKKALVPYWLEHGTKPHVIWASGYPSGPGPRVLAFFWPAIGGMFFGPKVNHPGTHPLNYMKNAFEAMKPEILRDIQGAVQDGVRR